MSSVLAEDVTKGQWVNAGPILGDVKVIAVRRNHDSVRLYFTCLGGVASEAYAPDEPIEVSSMKEEES